MNNSTGMEMRSYICDVDNLSATCNIFIRFVLSTCKIQRTILMKFFVESKKSIYIVNTAFMSGRVPKIFLLSWLIELENC